MSKFRRMFFHRHLLERAQELREWILGNEKKNARLSACIWSKSGTCACVRVRCIVKLLLIPWKMLLLKTQLNSLIHSLFMRPNISIFMGNGKGTGKSSSVFTIISVCYIRIKIVFTTILSSSPPPPPLLPSPPLPPGQQCCCLLIHNINLIDALLDRRSFHAHIWLVYLFFVQCSD